MLHFNNNAANTVQNIPILQGNNLTTEIKDVRYLAECVSNNKIISAIHLETNTFMFFSLHGLINACKKNDFNSFHTILTYGKYLLNREYLKLLLNAKQKSTNKTLFDYISEIREKFYIENKKQVSELNTFEDFNELATNEFARSKVDIEEELDIKTQLIYDQYILLLSDVIY